MSNKFERHKSTRWVKASVPTYGEDWGDDYEYEYEYGYEDEPQIGTQGGNHNRGDQSGSQSGHQLETGTIHETRELGEGRVYLEMGEAGRDGGEKFAGPSGDIEVEEGDRRENLEVRIGQELKLPSHNLVLSIDRLERGKMRFDDSSSEDDMELPSIMSLRQNSVVKSVDEMGSNRDNGSLRKPLRSNTSSLLNRKARNLETLPERDGSGALEPPTPTYSTTQQFLPETPLSNRSFQSDADSIQNEPENLNVIGSSLPTHREGPSETEHEERPQQPVELPQHQVEIPRVNTDLTTSSQESPYSETVSPLAILADKNKLDGQTEKTNEAYDTNADENAQKNERSENSKWQEGELDANKERSLAGTIQTDALSSLIQDLESASLAQHDLDKQRSNDEKKEGRHIAEEANTSVGSQSMLPKYDSIQNFTLPDFENQSFGQLDNEDSDYSESLKDAEHEKFKQRTRSMKFNSLSRKQPTLSDPGQKSAVLKDSEQAGDDLPGKKQTGTNRQELVSVDYANIADAVKGYMIDQKENDASGKESGHRYLTIVEEDHDASHDRDGVDSSDEEDGFESFKPAVEIGNDQSSLKDTDSVAYKDFISRRASTATSTFSMGNWNPNPSNFRDQFILENDNESNLNFNPYASDQTNYNKFVTSKEGSETLYQTTSNNSSLSVPETIEVELPNIDEDPDDNTTTSSDEDKIVPVDSVLKDHSYAKNVFKEELSSKDSLVKPDDSIDSKLAAESENKLTTKQKYSSLLGPDDSQSTTDSTSKRIESTSSLNNTTHSLPADKRAVSGTSAVTNVSKSLLGTTVTLPQSHKLYNWKSIMATSQPIDRIRLLKDALDAEYSSDTGLQTWLTETLRLSEASSNIHIGKIATEAYKNAAHNDIRRHISIRSKVSIVKDKVENSGLQASSIGKRFFNRGRKLMKSSATTE